MKNITSIVVQKMIAYFEKDVRRINHALKVYTFSKTIGEMEGLDDKTQLILDISSILHDIGIKESERKYNSSAGNYQEIEGPPVAQELLKDLNLDDDIIKRISYLIGNHHSYNNIDGIDLQILVEADFLVNAYEDNIKPESIKIFKEKYGQTKTFKTYLDSIY